jgi:methyl-accepting chemotaxis protein
LSSNGDIFEDFKKLVESIRQTNQNHFDSQVQILQQYKQTNDVNFLYFFFVRLISEDKYLSDNILKIDEKFVRLLQLMMVISDRNEQTFKRLSEMSKRVGEAESFQEELNAAHRKAEQDKQELKRDIMEAIKTINELEEQRQNETERTERES